MTPGCYYCSMLAMSLQSQALAAANLFPAALAYRAAKHTWTQTEAGVAE